MRNKNATFVATVGPTGGGRGYAAIAGILCVYIVYTVFLPRARMRSKG